MNERVLVVLPHPDDETFGAGGAIAKYAQQGIPVTYACLTLGEMGRNMGNPIFVNRETLPTVRKAELIKASEELGITDLRMLGYRDKTIEFEDEDRLADHIGQIIDDVQPTIVITFYPGHGVHPDHNATGFATIKAIGKLDPEQRPKTLCMAMSKDRIKCLGNPDIKINIQDVAERKIAAIMAHRSQSEPMFGTMLNLDDPDVKKRLFEESYWIYKW